MPRKHWLILSTLLCLLPLGHVTWGDESTAENWTIRPNGLRLVAELPDEPGFPRPFNWSTGTTIVMQCSPAEGYILGQDMRQSSIESFVDNLGNDLRAPNAQSLARETKIRNSGYSRDRKHALIEIFGGKVPNAKATSIHLRGSFALVVAGGKKTHTVKNVRLEAGESFAVGDHTVTITEIRQPRADRPAVIVSTEANQHIGNIRFLGADQQDLAARRVSWHGVTSAKLGNENDTDWRFSEKPPETVDLEVDEWLDVATVLVPIDVRVTVGLPPVTEE